MGQHARSPSPIPSVLTARFVSPAVCPRLFPASPLRRPQLCSEDYGWWWRSFLTSGSCALYVFLYSAFYFSKLEANLAVTYFLYFGYMSIICFGLFLMTGLVGFTSALWFTRKIYGSIKID